MKVQNFTSGGRQQFLRGGLDESDDLLSFYGRKPGQELVYGFSAFEVVHQVVDRYAGTGEHRCPPHDLSFGVKHIGQVDRAHSQKFSFHGKLEQVSSKPFSATFCKLKRQMI